MTTPRSRFIPLSMIALLAFPFSALAYDQEYMKKVNDRYFKSFGIKPEKPETIKPKFDNFTDLVKNIFQPTPFVLPDLTDHDYRELILKAIATPDHSTSTSVISHVTADKTDLVYGNGENCGDHLMFRLTTITQTNGTLEDLLQTKSGKATFVRKISQPHTDIQSLQQTQRVIKTCTENSHLRAKLTETLKNMGSDEHLFLNLYRSADAIDPELLKALYWQWFPSLNKSAKDLELGVRINNACSTLGLCGQELIGIYYLLKLRSHMQANGISSHTLRTLIPFLIAFNTLAGIPGKLAHWSVIKIQRDMANLLQTQLIGVANYINGAKKLYEHIKDNTTIAHNFKYFPALEALTKRSKSHSKEFYELIDLLETNTFEGEASFFSLTGRVLRAHLLMRTESVQKELAGIINAIGELDTYVALAHKINSTKDKEARYSFVEFDNTSSTPYLKATGIWNPFVNENQAVTNTIELGGAQPRNIVLSGPNKGGKSTITAATLANIIIAQVFGIAAAQSMTFTPFSNLDCYKNMTDDIASGISGLKSEAKRAKELILRIKNLGINQFSFILLDEIFTATSPDQAEKLAVWLIENLSELPNCLFIDPSHVEGSIQFAAQSPNCRNCHMGAIVNAEGKVIPTYKLEEGRSHIKNAEQVVQEEFGCLII